VAGRSTGVHPSRSAASYLRSNCASGRSGTDQRAGLDHTRRCTGARRTATIAAVADTGAATPATTAAVATTATAAAAAAAAAEGGKPTAGFRRHCSLVDAACAVTNNVATIAAT
jgi:hypothetical protein